MFKITLSIVLIVEEETEAAAHNKVMDCKSNEIFCSIYLLYQIQLTFHHQWLRSRQAYSKNSERKRNKVVFTYIKSKSLDGGC